MKPEVAGEGLVQPSVPRDCPGPSPAQSLTTVAQCSCGAAHTEDAWLSLRFVGVNVFADEPVTLELRDCPSCRSTMGLWRNREGLVCDQEGRVL